MATTSEPLADLQAAATRNPFSPADVEAAVYATEIDLIAAAWSMTPAEAIRWQNENDAVIKQPTTISGSYRTPVVQLTMFEVMQLEHDPEASLLPGLEQYERGKALLARARLVTARKRHLLADQGPTTCRNRVYYTLVPCEA